MPLTAQKTPLSAAEEKFQKYSLIGWYLGRAQWHEIRSLGSTSVVRLSVVAPVVSYLILANEHLLHFFEGWKFFCFYFGTVSIAVGALIYSTRCPGEAKKYDTAVEYAVAEAEFFTASPLIIEKAIGHSLSELKVQRPEIYRDILFIYTKIWISKNHPLREDRRDAIIALMDELWHLKIFGNRNSRVACRIFYDLGILLIFMPGVLTLLEIIQAFSAAVIQYFYPLG